MSAIYYCAKYDVSCELIENEIVFTDPKCDDPGCEYCSVRPEKLPLSCLGCFQSPDFSCLLEQ